MTAAVVFPALAPVRRRELGKFLLVDPLGRRRLAEADDVLGYRLADALADAEAATATATAAAASDSAAAAASAAAAEELTDAEQLAFAVACVALADRAEQEGLNPAYCVGPSFGERAALAYTGVLPFTDMIRLVSEIARVEREYFAVEHRDVVTHSFVRVPGQRLTALLADLGERDEWYEVSGYLDPDFHLVSLRERALAGFRAAISDVGGYSMHTMRPPAHAAAFAGLRERMATEVYARFELTEPRIPVVSYQTGSLLEDPSALRADLLDGLVRPIRWLDTVRSLSELGVTELCVTGPDNLYHRLRSSRDAFQTTLVDHRRILRRPRPRR
ncbi:ACP S-malonyltransferase [Parafrankia discariae]|uniref:ACP S-malonyltransferase n=1 Tax=Parafrankia discariae TaxID=365528 RepID=UPI00035D5015|nr:ACP S-malonyltransferase [Parafrankia discariae]